MRTTLFPVLASAVLAVVAGAQDTPWRHAGEPSTGYLRTWLVCGPFPAGEEPGPARHQTRFEEAPLGDEHELAPKAGDRVQTSNGVASWTTHTSTGDAISLDAAVSKENHVFAYAYAEVELERDTACILAFGSNDGARIWVNGERAWDYPAGRGLTLDDDLIPVVLHKGINRILVKVEERANRWEFAARLVPLTSERFTELTLFSVQTNAAGETQLVFNGPPSLLDGFIEKAVAAVFEPGIKKAVWNARLDSESHWTIELPTQDFAPYTANLNLTLADGTTHAVNIPFEAGERVEHTLFNAGASEYAIVLDADASESERWAAEELRHAMREIAGVDLPVTDTLGDDQPAIVVGHGKAARALLGRGADAPEPTDESFTWRNVGPNLVIWGGEERGTMYGVFDFLEHELGVRWYTPGVTVFPKRDRYAFDYLNHTEAPGIRVRNDFYHEAFNPIWAAHNRQNGVMGLRDQPGGVEGYWAVHTFFPLMPPEEFFDTHPEYYSLIDGKRMHERAQLCLTHPDVLDIITERLLKRMEESPDYLIYSISQNDWYNPCECDDCQAIATREESEAGVMVWFVNQVAERVENLHPDKYVGTLAYQYTRHPPKHVRPRENVVIRLCSIECCFAHDFASCPENEAFLSDLQGWSAIAPHLYIWDYVVNFSHYAQPYPNFGVLQNNIRMFRDNHAIGIMEQGAYQSRGGEFSELRMYVLGKLLWDPECDVDTVIDDFMHGYYGRAGQHVRAYFDLLHNQVTPDTHIHLGLKPDDPIFTEAFIRNADTIFDQAETVADTEAIRHRVELARLPLLYLKCQRNPTNAIYQGDYAKLKEICARENVTHFAESGNVEQFHNMMEAAGER